MFDWKQSADEIQNCIRLEVKCTFTLSLLGFIANLHGFLQFASMAFLVGLFRLFKTLCCENFEIMFKSFFKL
jgi:hypothetical protein